MERYGAFRDRGSGIAPFFPVPAQPSGIALPLHTFLAVIRLPVLLSLSLAYFLIFSWLPIGSLGKKAALWAILGIPGLWWVDLQVDGVRRGSIGQHVARLPRDGSVIASSFTSPIDALYLAAIFDPLFTRSFPGTRKVQKISLFKAMLDALLLTQKDPPVEADLIDLGELMRQNPDRCIAVFPECTTSNGRGILPFGPSVLTLPEKVKIFPVSIKYTPGDITTPVPGSYFTFLWNLCSKPTHAIRVRIAEAVHNTAAPPRHASRSPLRRPSYQTNLLENIYSEPRHTDEQPPTESEMTEEQKGVLDRIAEALARLGRVKRVGLGIEEKTEFVHLWTGRR